MGSSELIQIYIDDRQMGRDNREFDGDKDIYMVQWFRELIHKTLTKQQQGSLANTTLII